MLFCGGLRGLEEREVVLGHDARTGVVHDRVEDEPRAARGGERAAKGATRQPSSTILKTNVSNTFGYKRYAE